MKKLASKLDHFSLSCRQTGLSLVELMISLTIGLILLAGITTLIVQQSTTRREMEKSSRQIENGRYAMEILHDDIEHAGFYGDYSPPRNATYTVPADPCDTTPANQGWSAATSPITAPVAVQGYAGAASNPAPSTCSSLITNYQPNTDILIIRRMASTAVDPATAVAGVTYLQAKRCNTDGPSFQFGTSNFTLRQKDCVTPALLYGYIVRIYYISSCSVVTGSTCADSIPTLKMVEFMNGAQTTIPLVEGIEDMQFDYGIDTTSDGAPDSYASAPTAANWPNIMTVRVNLLARNNEATPGYTDNKTYTLGDAASVTPGGSFKRHAYSQLIRLTNPSGRRE